MFCLPGWGLIRKPETEHWTVHSVSALQHSLCYSSTVCTNKTLHSQHPKLKRRIKSWSGTSPSSPQPREGRWDFYRELFADKEQTKRRVLRVEISLTSVHQLGNNIPGLSSQTVSLQITLFSCWTGWCVCVWLLRLWTQILDHRRHPPLDVRSINRSVNPLSRRYDMRGLGHRLTVKSS